MKILRTFLLLFFLTLQVSASNKKILDLADALGLAESRGWKKLLHIEPNAIGLNSNQITDKNFYFSETKDYLSKSELEATLLAFTEPSEKYARLIDYPIKKNLGAEKIIEKILDHSQHPICRFPARLLFLKSALPEAIEYWASLPKVNCVYQNIFLEATDPESISFVFSSYYSDSPGSAFGHTFFRINRLSNNSKIKQELLDYGVGYAANVTVSNSALYAVMGLLGGFTGTWSNLPYYYKVREYNHFESRDLWSYDLDLQPDEVKMLALHLWEVGPHYYTYYFFTQNCAFHMLTLLEAAAPRLHLTEHVPFYYVIPSDSMKALFYEKNLVKSISYRPSVRKVFLERAQQLNPSTFSKFKTYAQSGNITEIFNITTDSERALFLDAAIDLQDLRHPGATPGATIENDKVNFKIKEDLLIRRAAVNFISPELNIKANLEDHPENSHGSSRIGLTYQTKSQIKSGNIEYRFALHDLLDPIAGLPQNSQLEFFNFNFQILPGQLKFQEMNIFKVFNINPINFFEKKPTWAVELGIQNKKSYCSFTDADCFLNGLLLKFGAAKNIFSENFTLWSLFTTNLRYGSTLIGSKYYVAPGFEFGLLSRFSQSSSILARFNREYPLDRNYNQFYEVELRHSPAKDLNIGLRVKDDLYGVVAYYYY